MRYYRVHDTGDDYDPSRWFLGVPRDPSTGHEDPWQFTAGRPVVAPPGGFVVRQDVHGTPHHLSFAAFDVPIVSADLGVALYATAGSSVQLLSVAVEGAPGRYFVLNVTSAVRCLDESRSVFTKFPAGDSFGRAGRYRMVTKLRIDKAQLAGQHVLRIENWLSPLIVSAHLLTVLKEFSIPGLICEEV